MEALSTTHRCVAPDLRGYNLSDRPEELEAYAPEALVSDVLAIIEGCGTEEATVIGHNWGGFVAWHTAMDAPDRVSRLGIVNMPHPWAIARELATNPAQAEAAPMSACPSSWRPTRGSISQGCRPGSGIRRS
ncbi:alpha/beta fold hydrolase [Breoghania sp.]|uniref:alpha/beta fold hydrolase n=1 Tax=Breoghania sp. TaxID=2065378 RepID=UPI00262486CD|nr:alpha/beta fold hydrolase [Breoghania sp.]MDJ0933487.1 alpha/beta fold hydrolase [Breoghania sp.]